MKPLEFTVISRLTDLGEIMWDLHPEDHFENVIDRCLDIKVIEKSAFDKLLAASREMAETMSHHSDCGSDRENSLSKQLESFRNTLKEMGLEDE